MKEIRVLIIGKTGAGISTVGNSLLGRMHFDTKASSTSRTVRCELGEGTLDNGTVLKVVDTPGVFHTEITGDRISSTFVEAFRIFGTGGAHVLLFVHKAGRFTQEELDTLTFLKVVFGERIVQHIVLVLTFKDHLDDEGINFQEYIETATSDYTDFIRECGNRISAINNRVPMSQREEDVQTILDLIRESITLNGESSCISEHTFKDVLETRVREQGGRSGVEERRIEDNKRKLTELTQKPGYSTAVAANMSEVSCAVL